VLFTIVVGIWIFCGIVIGCIMPPARGLVSSSIMYFHVPMAIAMEVAFFCAAYQGALWLRKRNAEHDAKSFAFAEVGAWLGVIATVTGAIWAKLNWGAYWSWDPQQIGIVAVLLTYAALFALRGAVDDEGKRRDLWAVYAIIGVLAAIFWTFIFRRLTPATLHPPDTLLKSEPLYKLALWFNVFGYILLMTKLAALRAKLEMFSHSQRTREEAAEYSREAATELQTA
jgi:heme exporter protein C